MLYIDKSYVHGVGVFTDKNLKAMDIINEPMIINGKFGNINRITFFGSKVNHSYTPNAFLYFYPKTNIYYLCALKDIMKNTELVVDYNLTPDFIKRPEPHFK